MPYDSKIFKDFPHYEKNETAFKKKFNQIKDKDSLVDLLGKMFEYIPEKRCSATDALQHKFFDDIRVEYHAMIEKYNSSAN